MYINYISSSHKKNLKIFLNVWLSPEPLLTCIHNSDVERKNTVQKVANSNPVKGGWLF